MAGKVIVHLYYADWCGHCVAFKPEWNKLTGGFEHKDLVFAQTEADQLATMSNKPNIRGFPTILVTNKAGKTTQYTGERTKDALINYIRPLLSSGGAVKKSKAKLSKKGSKKMSKKGSKKLSKKSYKKKSKKSKK
jgi:thioredoxin-like negative regulator of GroEL